MARSDRVMHYAAVWRTRENWERVFGLKVMDMADFKSGKALNEELGKGTALFKSDDAYYHKDNTRPVRKEETDDGL